MKTRVIAFYLPQFHPIPENDKWWGKGFTEWTNVARAKPLFRGHYQPRIPADLGFYDLRYPEVRELQAEMAREAGVEGFCYWHYWFGNGKRLLERPFDEVLKSGRPDFPFCLGWANHTWTNRTWENARINKGVLIEQTYGDIAEWERHFYAVLPAFLNKRYIQVDGKPVFVIFNPIELENARRFLDSWRALAEINHLNGIHFVACSEASSSFRIGIDGKKIRVVPRVDNAGEVYRGVLDLGFDAIVSSGRNRAEMLVGGKYSRLVYVALNQLGIQFSHKCYHHRDIMRNYYVVEDAWENVYPSLLPQWDKSPRTGKAIDIYINSSPELFFDSIREAGKLLVSKRPQHQILFLRSWNEWGEGNYVEPDLKFGKGYLEALRKALD
jgi:hypothetical protein